MRPSIMAAAPVLTVLLALAAPARAEERVASRPGVMCRSPEALGRLTLPDGSSRSAALRPRPEDLRTKATGGCIDIPPRARVSVLEAFHNTSSVLFDPGDGSGAQTFTIPNIDFAAASDGPNVAQGDVSRGVSLGTSERLGVRVLADGPDWCSQAPRLRVEVQDPAVLGSPALDRLLQEFGAAVLARRCPSVGTVRFTGSVGGRPSGWQASASAAEGWTVHPATSPGPAPGLAFDLDHVDGGGPLLGSRTPAAVPPPSRSGALPGLAPPFPTAEASASPAEAAVPPVPEASYAVGSCPVPYPGAVDHRAPLVCTCDQASLEEGGVFGTDLYSYASVPCRAARHAGVLEAVGGTAAFFPAPGQRPAQGSDRNGVDSGADNAPEAFTVRRATPAVMAFVRGLTLRNRDPAMEIAIRAPDDRVMIAQPTPPPTLPDFVTSAPAVGVAIALPAADAVSLPIPPPPLAGGLPLVVWRAVRAGSPN